MNTLRASLLLTITICLPSFTYASPYELSMFSGPPGMRGLSSSGINNRGEITGYGFGNVGPDTFIRSSDGRISVFELPESFYSFSTTDAINDFGSVVGSVHDETGRHPYLRTSDGTVQIIQIPYTAFGLVAPHHESAIATGINNSGQIIGRFQALTVNKTAYSGSFLMQPDGTFVEIKPSLGTSVYGISNNGYLVGIYLSNGSQMPFVMDSSSLRIVRSYPNLPAPSGSFLTSLFSINNNGDIVGSYDMSYGAFITNLYTDGFASLPSPKYCMVSAINDLGAITGTCADDQGYVLTPTTIPEPVTTHTVFTAAVIGLVAFLKNRRSRLTFVGRVNKSTRTCFVKTLPTPTPEMSNVS